MFRELGFHKENGKLNWLVIFISLLWANSILMEYLRGVFLRLPLFNAGLGFPAIYCIYTVSLLMALPSMVKRLRPIIFLFPVLILAYYLLSYSLLPRNTYILDKSATSFFFSVLPMFFIGAVWNSEELIKPLHLISRLSIIMALVYMVLFGRQVSGVNAMYLDEMTKAYAILPHLCLVTYFASYQKNKIDILLTLIGIAYAFTLGTRGPLVCYAGFIILCIGFVLKKRIVLFLLAGLIPLLIVFLADSSQTFLKSLVRLCKKMGLSARIFDQILEGTFMVSKGRDDIRETLLNRLSDHDFIGYGFFADRTLIPQSVKKGIHAVRYAHNIVLEMWVNFGRITGSIIFATILILIARAFIKSRNQSTRLFIVLFTCCTIGHLLLSSSYLIQGWFFLFLGFVMTTKREQLQS